MSAEEKQPVPVTDAEKRLQAGEPVEFPLPKEPESEESRRARTVQAAWIAQLADKHRREVALPIQITNAIIAGTLDLAHAEFACRVHLINCTFEQPADFSFAQFVGAADFTRCEFRKDAEFHGARVNSDLICKGVRFDQIADFDRIQIEHSGVFDAAENGQPTRFAGEARFLGAHLQGQARFNGAVFEQRAVFDGIQVDEDAFFRPGGQGPVRFGSEARFLGAHIHGTADFEGAQFASTAAFDRMQVDGGTFFPPGEQGPVRFGGEARFHDVYIQGLADFEDAQFENKAVFEHARFENATLFRGAHFSHEHQATFAGARFERGAFFLGSAFRGPTTFRAAISERDADFRDAVFGGPANFRDAHFHVVEFGKDTHPFEAAVDLLGFTYDRIQAPWRALLDKVLPYDRQPYTQMEKFFRSAGNTEEADEVYYERRRKEGAGLRPWSSPLSWSWDRAYRALAGYGVRIWPLVVLIVALVVCGMLVFDQDGALEWSKDLPKGSSPPFRNWVDSLGVSLRLVTGIEFPAGAGWEPSGSRLIFPEWQWMRNSTYAFLHSLVGLVLVPFVVASIFDRLRRREGD